jgi:hypothetical protein
VPRLAAFVTSILTQPRGRLDAGEAAEPPLRQVIDVLQQVVMCIHDAEKRAISVLEIYEDDGKKKGDEIDGRSLERIHFLTTSMASTP